MEERKKSEACMRCCLRLFLLVRKGEKAKEIPRRLLRWIDWAIGTGTGTGTELILILRWCLRKEEIPICFLIPLWSVFVRVRSCPSELYFEELILFQDLPAALLHAFGLDVNYHVSLEARDERPGPRYSRPGSLP